MLNCVKYILDNGLEALNRDFGIDIKDYDKFVMLNYDQIESPKFNPIVDECRGLILAKDNWQVLCQSFDRFYNYGEDPNTSAFPMHLAKVTEKVDGSLVRFWWNPFDGMWRVATRKMAFAEGLVNNGTTTFSDVVNRVVGSPNMYFYNDDDLIGKTIICELVSPETRIVKPYGETALYYLATRDNKTGEYLTIPEHTENRKYDLDWYFTGMKFPKVYTFATLPECLEALRELPTLDEGYVACTPDNWRIKVKSPTYLAVAHMRNNGAMSESRIVYTIMSGEADEYLNYFDEDREVFKPWMDAYNALVEELRLSFSKYYGIQDQKTFALTVKDLPYAGILFSMRKTGKTGAELLAQTLKKCDKGKAPESLVKMLRDMMK